MRVPYFDDNNGQLVYKGLADPARDGLDDGAYLRDKEETLTRLLLANMKSLCTKRSIPFIVVHLPDTPSTDFDAQIAPIVGEDFYVDLRREIDYSKTHLRFDGHPSPEGHRQIAEALKPVLNRLLN